MKRKWAYLGALLPLSTAASAWAIGATGDGYDPKAAGRKKNVIDEEDGKLAGKQGDKQSEDIEAHGVRAPSGGGSDEDVAGKDGIGGLNQALSAGDPKVQVLLPPVDSSMYAPGSAGDTPSPMQLGAGGGEVVTVTNVTLQQGESGNGLGTDPSTMPAEETGYVEPDPADADAMMMLLGGTATGSGHGAQSSGEIAFDIVDYGPITIGYGYANFTAFGSDGAQADTFGDVIGADLVFSYTDGASYGPWAYSATYVLAIDFEDEPVFGAQNLDSLDWMQMLAQGPFGQHIMGYEEDVSVSGNTAHVSLSGQVAGDPEAVDINIATLTFDNIGSTIMAWMQAGQTSLSFKGEAESVDSLASASGSLFVIEDEFSSVTGVAVGIA